MNCPAYTPPSAPKACPWKLRGVVRGLLCFYLAFCVAFIPLDFRFVGLDSADTPTLEVQRNEAHAFVPVAAGGAAAVAAALGITETELACGMAVVFAAGAGLYLYYNANSDLSSWPTDQAWPGFKPWDDLTPQEKQNWVGQDGDVGDYWQQQLDLYTLNYGLWDYDQQGNPQPTPEPSDPDDKEKWFTKNNVITALGTGAAVSLGTIASTLVNDAANSLADMLFGKDISDNTTLGLDYRNNALVDGRIVNLGYLGIYGNNGLTSDSWVFYEYDKSTSWRNVYYAGTGITLTNPIVMKNDNYDRYRGYASTDLVSLRGMSIAADGTFSYSSNPSSVRVKTYSYYNLEYYLNAASPFTFEFPNGTTLTNGVFSGQATQDVDYGQLTGTPSAITNNILNNPNYITNVNNYAAVDADNQKAAQLPSSFTGANNTPVYDDFVKTTPNEDVTPIPDDQPIPGPGPGPGPDNPTDYEDDFSDKVAELLAQPFDQLFPFCLIGDLRVFTEKVNSAFNGGGMTRSEPNYDELVIPLEQFNVDGLEDITFDLVPLKGMGVIVKPWINALLVVALLIGSFRFFLNRGGE